VETEKDSSGDWRDLHIDGTRGPELTGPDTRATRSLEHARADVSDYRKRVLRGCVGRHFVSDRHAPGRYLARWRSCATASQIQANIRTLGFKVNDVKILLNRHAHFDHAGGLAELKRASGAKLVSMSGDADLLEHGGRGDFFF
jgi:glyoxylase-like metal-dependent hydrolase (beta-lactamase superfamily II)